jgi:hypothetical protein
MTYENMRSYSLSLSGLNRRHVIEQIDIRNISLSRSENRSAENDCLPVAQNDCYPFM